MHAKPFGLILAKLSKDELVKSYNMSLCGTVTVNGLSIISKGVIIK